MKIPGLPIWPYCGPTSVGVQIGRLEIAWCYLWGGGWKHWWQLDRWRINWWPK